MGKHAAGMQVAARQGIGVGSGDIAEGFVLHGRLRQLCHVARRRVMIGAVQAVGVGEMRGCAAIHGRRLVHQVYKLPNAAADGFGNQVRALVGGAHKGAVQQVLKVDAFANVQPHIRGVLVQALQGRFGQVHRLVHIAHHNAQQDGQNLGRGGGKHHLVGVFLKNDLAGGGLNQNGGFGV